MAMNNPYAKNPMMTGNPGQGYYPPTASYQMPPAMGPQNPMADAATPATPTTVPTVPTVPGASGPATGAISSANPLYDPTSSMLHALNLLHINPGNPNPLVKALLKKADDLAYQALARVQMNNGDVSNDQNMTSTFQDLVNQALHGGKVFQSYGQDTLGALQSAAQPGFNDPTASPGAKLLASLFSDRNTGMNISSSLLYGGYSPNVGSALSASLSGALDPYQQALESGSALQNNQTIIDFILSRLRGGQ